MRAVFQDVEASGMKQVEPIMMVRNAQQAAESDGDPARRSTRRTHDSGSHCSRRTADMRSRRSCRLSVWCVLIVMGGVFCGGCGEAFVNQTTTLGGAAAGLRGDLRVLFINNTEFRTVLTYGTFDQADRESQPDFGQFSPDPFDTTLEPNADSGIQRIQCGRVFAIGSDRLLTAIEENAAADSLVSEALVTGVQFWSPAAVDGGEDATLAGAATPLEALLGVDFPCESLLIIRFETDGAQMPTFRIDFELIASESQR